MAGRTYKWASALEWFIDFQGVDKHFALLSHLIGDGRVTSDDIQDCFEGEMDEDGFFDGWPADEDYPLRQLEGENQCGAACKFCNQDVSDDDIDALDDGIMPDDFECGEEMEDGIFEKCPIRLWIASGKKVE